MTTTTATKTTTTTIPSTYTNSTYTQKNILKSCECTTVLIHASSNCIIYDLEDCQPNDCNIKNCKIAEFSEMAFCPKTNCVPIKPDEKKKQSFGAVHFLGSCRCSSPSSCCFYFFDQKKEEWRG